METIHQTLSIENILSIITNKIVNIIKKIKKIKKYYIGDSVSNMTRHYLQIELPREIFYR